MKVTIIWSSANSDGLTAKAVGSFKDGLVKHGTEVKEIRLNKASIGTCRACGNGWGSCKSAGECAMKDDFADIYEELKTSDGIVFVSAVYWSDMTEVMKSFVDRLRRCEAGKNHFLAEKRCVLVACAGGTGRGTLECLQHMEQALVHMNMRAYDRISVIRYNSDYVIPMLENAGEIYADRLESGFDMRY